MFILSRRGGLLGRLIVERLQRVGHSVGVLGATPAQADAMSPSGDVTGILLDGRDVARHLAYGRCLLLLPEGPGERALDETAIVREAVRAGIPRIVRLGMHGSPPPHAAGEAAVAQSGLPYSLIQPHLLMQDLLLFAPSIRAGYPLYGPPGAIGFVDVRDVADSTARLVQRPVHQRETHVLTGPRTWTLQEVAAALGDAIGRPVPFEPVSAEGLVAKVQQIGLSRGRAQTVAAILGSYRDAEPTRNVSRLTGLPPRALEMFLLDHRNHFGQGLPQAATGAVALLDHALSW